jgi:hypothetical protein
MRLYVCYGTWTAGKPIHPHPCGEAHAALRASGHVPQLIHSHGLGLLPSVVNDRFAGRRQVKEMTGNYWVPVLVTDDDEVIQGSGQIVEWARAHPAGAAGGHSAGSAGSAGAGAAGHPTGG